MTAQLHRRTFIWSMWLCIFLTMNIGMSFMFFSILIGLPPFFSALFLMGGIYLAFGLLAGEAVYTVDQIGLRQQIGPMSWFKFVDKKIDRQFTWKDIEWVQMGTDVNRSFGEYHYVKIKLNQWPYNLQISSDKADLNEYNHFISVFNQVSGNQDKVQHNNNTNEKVSTPSHHSDEAIPSPKLSTSSKVIIKPDFYKTKKAKIIFYLFCLFFVGLIGLMISTGIFKVTYALRFLIIIIPGMGYYYWRLFVKGKKN